MNCKDCRYLYTNVVSVGLNGSPYKYYCVKNKFRPYNSTFPLGASFLSDNKIFYTKEQLEYFNLHENICEEKLGFTRSELTNFVISGFAIIISCISLTISINDNKEKVENRNYIKQQIDSLTKNKNSVVSIKVDTINELKFPRVSNLQRLPATHTKK